MVVVYSWGYPWEGAVLATVTVGSSSGSQLLIAFRFQTGALKRKVVP